MSVTQEQMFEDLGTEPEADRGIPLRQPIVEEKPQAEAAEETPELKESQEDAAEGQETLEEVPETTEEIQAEGQAEKIRAKDFAESAGWSLEEFYRDVLVPGQDGDITLSEALDNYKTLQAENESLRTERQQLEAKATQAPQPVQQYAPEAVELWNEANFLQKTLDNTDWSQMEPIQRVELKDRYRDEIAKLRGDAQAKQGEHLQKVRTAMQQWESEVKAQMVKEIPEWRAESVKVQEMDGLGSYLLSEGAERQTVDQILNGNPWATRMLRRLWQYEKEHAATQKAVKKVQKVPRHMKPGAGHQAPKKPSLAEVGKYVNAAPSRRIRDQRLMEADFDDALLPK